MNSIFDFRFFYAMVNKIIKENIMSQNNQIQAPIADQQQSVYEDEISLIDIYLTIKRNSKLFFSVVILSFLISLAITYYKHQSQMGSASSKVPAIEHVLIIEIGRVFGDKNYYIDPPTNTLEKIKNIYIPKLNQTAITAEHIKNSDLIVIKATQTSDTVNYDKLLLTLADYILKDHNSAINLNNKNNIKPTKIIEPHIKRIVESKSKSNILIPILGLILGVFLGFFAVIVGEFIKKVKQAESEIKTS